MNCLSSMIKYIIYIFNIIFLICGILLIVLGSIMLSDVGNFASLDDAVNTDTIPILLIIMGCIIFVISFFGCCGAIRENNCCTMIYAIFMFILFCLQIALVIWVFVKFNDFLNTMSDLVDKSWEQNNNAHGYPMDGLQLGFKCCGVTGYQDYLNANQVVPASCCGSKSGVCTADIYQNKPGCRNEFVDFWSSNMDIIRYAGIGVALIELVAFTFACCLANSIRKSRGSSF